MGGGRCTGAGAQAAGGGVHGCGRGAETRGQHVYRGEATEGQNTVGTVFFRVLANSG